MRGVRGGGGQKKREKRVEVLCVQENFSYGLCRSSYCCNFFYTLNFFSCTNVFSRFVDDDEFYF